MLLLLIFGAGFFYFLQRRNKIKRERDVQKLLTEKKLSELSPHQFDYVALGHIHVVKQVEVNTWYSGALEHTSSNIWSEAKEPKGFLEVRLANNPRKSQVKFHTLKAPREVIWLPAMNAATAKDPESLNLRIMAALDNIPGGVDGKIIRQEVIEIPKEIFRSISLRHFKEYRLKALHLQLELKLETPSGIMLTDKTGISSKPLVDQLTTFTLEYRKSKPVQLTDRLVEIFNHYFTELAAKEDEAA